MAKRPLLFAVGTNTLRFDNEGRNLAVTVYYPAKGRATTLDVEHAPRATQWGPYPLILFSHDLGATARSYQPLLHSWAEHGYVVAVPAYAAPTTDSADDEWQGRGRPRRTRRRRELRHRSHVRPRRRVASPASSTVTMSLPRATRSARSSRTCSRSASTARDERINAAVALSGGIAGDAGGYFTDVVTPLLAIHGDADETDPIDGTTAIYALASPPKFFVRLLGGDHNTAFEKSGSAAFQVVDETTLDFFSAYLNGRPSGLQQLTRDGTVAEVAKIKSATR